jgi:hypothetical protein
LTGVSPFSREWQKFVILNEVKNLKKFCIEM